MFMLLSFGMQQLVKKRRKKLIRIAVEEVKFNLQKMLSF